MNAEEQRAMENSIELAVSKGNEPIWEKLRDHDTSIALNKQEIEQSTAGQIAQGQRLGVVEQDMTLLKSDKGWIRRIVGLLVGILVGAGVAVLAWWLNGKGGI